MGTRAVVCQDSQLRVVELPTPEPAAGQLLLKVLRCGICGSDLHARHHADAQADVLAEAGYDGMVRARDAVVFGHEFAGEVLEHGPGGGSTPIGSTVVAFPLRRRGREVHPIGLSAAAPGAYAEHVVVEESLTFAVPDDLSPERAALTEPLAVGLHAVRRAEVTESDVAVVIGCGPVGLAVIAMLKAEGVRRVVASDPSPGRRALATACGADLVVDPAVDSPFATAAADGHLTSVADLAALGLGAMDQLRAAPVPWQDLMRAAEAGGGLARPVVFECVGVPGMLESIVSTAPLRSRVVVTGVCMVPDTFRPAMAVNKEVDLRFVVGYSPLELHESLTRIADGTVDVAPLVTGTVGLDGVAGAFDALGRPGEHAKVLIDPASAARL